VTNEERQRCFYLVSISQDRSFDEYVTTPLKVRVEKYQRQLKQADDMREVFRAQGALEGIDAFMQLFKRAKDELENSRGENDVGRSNNH
jgi:hypothetical protein